jgi:hypothetical protein
MACVKKVLCCGGRKYDDRITVKRTLDGLNEQGGISMVIEGGAFGADLLSREWAEYRGILVTTVRADWGRYGPSAGPLRNSKMLLLSPDLVVAFPGGSGTQNMVMQARSAGVDVLLVDPNMQSLS